MVFFASVSFIALPVTAFIYIDNLVLNARIDKTLQQLEQREKKKYHERTNSKMDGQTTDDSGRD
jgi:DNA-binding LytR/AlgR family response regulator